MTELTTNQTRMRIDTVEGRAIPVRGDDIDTDRIIPARFLRAVSFEGLEAHVFEDDRAAAGGRHPFSNPAYAGARVLLVNRNFGCGSSREHAPQALFRWGIRAIVGESFSEIFLGNATMLGLPCLSLDRTAVEALMQAVERTPDTVVSVSVSTLEVTARGATTAAGAAVRASGQMRGPMREAFLSGAWDPAGMLLDRYEEVRRVADRLPYLTGFAPHPASLPEPFSGTLPPRATSGRGDTPAAPPGGARARRPGPR